VRRPAPGPAAPAWWQRGAVYQVYPRSFADADGDGVGDLRGLAAQLDHLSELQVEAVWLSPIFTSPMADFGYDVADYCDVDPLFGTLADLDALVDECHSRDIRVVLDWVPNHTSDRHPWFDASRSAREDPKRDWYVWRTGPPGGGPPNDWDSTFEAVGPAWTFDERTGQWYLHSFMAEQPDLNWDNPEVEAAMHDVLRFWLERGIDGFRLDAIVKIAKDPLLRSNGSGTLRHHENWGSIHDRLRGIRRVVDEYPDRMIVGEVDAWDLHGLVSFLKGGDQLHLAHNLLVTDLPWSPEAFAALIEDFEALADQTSWPAWFFSNHDMSRAASRFDAGGGTGAARARALLLMLYALRGTPFIYQGEELGLPDAVVPPERVVDVDGRDPERAPIPWRPPSEAGPGAGFTDGEPWLPLVEDAESLNVERQAADPRSALSLTRRLAALRAAEPALQGGDQRPCNLGHTVLAWTRDDAFLAAVNFATEPVAVALPDGVSLVLSTDPDRAPDDLSATLRPSEGVLLRLPS
jgi:alpha-glucosidase